MYSVEFYGRMLADEVRTQAFVQALKQAVQPDSVVIDLGSGPGFFALMAAKFGCRHVYAIEPDNVIQVGIDAAEMNGLSDRITFIQDFSTNVSLPERANVILADLRGILPFFSRSLPSIQDARTRLLADDGVLIPRRDTLYAALVHAPLTYQKLTGPWNVDPAISLAPGQQLVLNTWIKFHPASDDLLCTPISWHTIDYYNISSFDVSSEMTFTVNRSGTAHGIAIWFDSEVTDEIVLSNSPGLTERIYGRAFFPFLQPVDLESDESVHLRVRADLIKDDYIWTWETRVGDAQQPRAHFKQSTMFGRPVSPAQLRRRAGSFTPVATSDAVIESYVVSQMDGASTVETIAARVAERFPEKLSQEEAFDLVADLSLKFSK
jgi:protein arginine N-methyltransferase 1